MVWQLLPEYECLTVKSDKNRTDWMIVFWDGDWTNEAGKIVEQLGDIRRLFIQCPDPSPTPPSPGPTPTPGEKNEN